MIIIFASAIGRFPIGGNAWSDLQYLLGLRALGHDVFYLEECGLESWVYNWQTEQFTTELDYPEIASEYFAAQKVIGSLMERAGL